MKYRTLTFALAVGAATTAGLSLLKVNKPVVIGSTAVVVVVGAGLVISFKKQDKSSKTIDISSEEVSRSEPEPTTAKEFFERGNNKVTQLDTEGAIIDYTKAIEIEPKDSDIYLYRGLAKKELSDLNGAREDLMHAAILGNKDASERLKNTYPNLQSLIDAETEQIIKDPNNRNAFINRGLLKEKFDLIDALNDYTQAIRIDSKNAKSYFYRGIVKSKLKNNLDAINDFRKAMEIDPYKYRESYDRNIANKLIDQLIEQDFEESKNEENALGDLLGNLLRIETQTIPYDSYEYNLRGISKYQEGDIHGSIYDFSKALDIDKKDECLHFNRGRARHVQGDYLFNKADLTDNIELNDYLYDLGSKIYELAITDFTNAIKINPHNAKAYSRRALARIRFRDKEEGCLYTVYHDNSRDAYRDLKRSSELGDQNAQNIIRTFLKRQIFTQQDIIDEEVSNSESGENTSKYFLECANRKVANFETQGAISDYTKAIELDPEDSSIYRFRGLAKKELGNIKDAYKDWLKSAALGDRKAIKLLITHNKKDPKEIEMIDYLPLEFYLESSKTKYKSGDYKSAIDALNKAIEMHPNNGIFYSLRGIFKFSSGHPLEAIFDLDKAIELNPYDAINYFYRGTCLKNPFKGKTDLVGAISDFNNVVKVKESSESYLQLGFCQSLLGNFKDAINDFNKAIQINPYLETDPKILKAIDLAKNNSKENC